MTLDNIVNYAKIGTISVVATSVAPVIFLLNSICKIKGLISEHFNEGQLREVINEEAQKLGIAPDKIEFDHEAVWEDDISARVEKKDGKYILSFGHSLTRATIRHELYHIYSGDCDGKNDIDNTYLNWLNRYFVRETKAEIYGSFGIRLDRPK